MSNKDSSELNSEVLKEAALFGYKRFVDQGVTNPDDVPLDSPAHESFYVWAKQIDSEAGDNSEKQLRADLAKTMFYVDAGFTDPDYLDEVLKEWLSQSAEDAPKDNDSPERQETRRQIAAAMLKVKHILANNSE